ncbi:MAG TPA: hypothetical protein VKV20_15880 [Ktedonobacteraceae bacterium]|jgi:hypothetical protein|nr:hypothetical protein [Ktedonobacteraceae bacterium]
MTASEEMKDSYYVQRLTEQIFLIRERMGAGGEPGPDDRIVRSFSVRHDAYMYADSLNNKPNKSINTRDDGNSIRVKKGSHEHGN